MVNDFLVVTPLFKGQGVSDEWGTIDQSNVRIHIVVEISWGTRDKELPKECMRLLKFGKIIGIWFVDIFCIF